MKKIYLVGLLCFGHAIADETYIYPAEGQSAEQQKQDEFECYQWAAEQSGFDPISDSAVAASAPPDTTTETTSEDEDGGVGKAALGGATKGAVIAEVSDGDAGKGAAAGAALGVRKGKREKQKAQALEEQQQAAAAERARAEAEAKQRQQRQNYEKANAVCLEGRGYTIK